jgi:nucleotide-binding universal stress UspA family protein
VITLKNVLVATDFEEPADVALAYGRELARTFGAALHFVHVVDDVSAHVIGTAAYPEYLTNLSLLQAEIDKGAETRLNAMLFDEDREKLNARATVLVSTKPWLAVVEYARAEGIDVIVVGTRGRGGVGHLVLGSVAERIVRLAPCPVLVVRHPEREFVRPDALQAVVKA